MFGFKHAPIQRKLMLLVLLTSVLAMVLLRGTSFIYEFTTFRRTLQQQLATLGAVVASNSTAALAFQNEDDAEETLSALKAERYVVAAALYDRSGQLFATYPAALPAERLPAQPGADGYRTVPGHIIGFQPVLQRDRRLGTLYLDFETAPLVSEWLWLSLGAAALAFVVVLVLTYFPARVLQRQISRPILALAETARGVSERHDYTVRATKFFPDEIGTLTDAFNAMLAELERNTQELETRVRDRTAQVAAATDDLRREQARLKFIFDTMPVGLSFATTAPDGTTIRLLNDTHLRLCGFTRDQVINQADFARASHADDRERQAGLVRELEAGTIDRFTLDKRYVHADGQIVWVILTAQRRRLEDGTCEDLSVVVDITERKRTEDALRLANHRLEVQTGQLEAANSELEAFSYSVSHDLRAPLRHVHGFSNLLDKHAGATFDEKGRRYLTTIAGAAKQMGQLIDDLLAFSRAGRTALVPKEIATDALVAEVIRNGRYDTDGQAIAWDIAPLPAVRGDLAMLRQVWSNLIDNAVKYSKRSPSPRIVVRARAAESPAPELVFSVADNGVGFDMAYVGKLFGVFQRLHGATDFEGTGIGLANVRRIVARHGGRTWAEGKVGEGATFFFSLPLLNLNETQPV